MPLFTRPTTNWRPLPLTPFFLAPFALLCLLLVLLLEVTLRACLPDGCPAFGAPSSNTTSDLSTYAQGYSPATTSFVYNYLPTIVTVSFGLLCALVHHDAMRMEPWFQMSLAEGAVAEESLLLAYSYMMPPSVPVAAWKNRHWTVFTASLLVLLSTTLLTPLTAGLFDTTALTFTSTSPTTHRLLRWTYHPGEDLDDASRSNATIGGYSSRHEYLAYTHGWLNGSLPPFTTATYALSPWATAESLLSANTTTTPSQEEQHWTGDTTLYEADLHCTEATRTPLEVPGVGLIGYNLTSPTAPYLSYPLWDPGLANATDYDLMGTISASIPAFDSWSYYKDRPRFQTGADWYVLADLPASLADPRTYTDAQRSVRLTTAVYVVAEAPAPISPGWDVKVVETPGKSLLPPRWTAVFCSPAYYAQRVRAVVAMPSGRVVSVTRVGTREEIPSANDTSVLGDLLWNLNSGLIRSTQDDPRYYDRNGKQIGLGQVPQDPADSGSHLVRRFGGTEGMMRVQAKNEDVVQNGFPAFALNSVRNETVEGLLEWERLAGVYRDALRLTFAMLCTDEWVRGRTEENATVVVERRSGVVRGYAASEGWARGLQGVLSVLAVLAGGLAVAVMRRRTELDGEPGSLGAALGVMERSEELRKMLSGVELHPMATVKRMLRISGRRYKLVLEEGVGPRVEVLEAGGVGEGVLVKLEDQEVDEREYREKDVWPVSRGSAITFITFFTVMLALVVVVCVLVGVDYGIPTPSPPTSIPYKILFTYTPTLLALLIEPLLVSLGSHLCMLAPYTPLLRGPTRASHSLSLDLDKSPPHFQLLRALRAKHWLIAALSAAILLSNVLAVALSALFTPDARVVTQDVTLQAPTSAALKGGFRGVKLLESHYTLYGTLSSSIAAPNWTTADAYILPFHLPPSSSSTTFSTLTSRTLSLSSAITCTPLPTSLITTTCYPTGTNGSALGPCLTSFTGGTSSGYITVSDPCWPTANTTTSNTNLATKPARYDSPAGDWLSWSAACPATFFAAWMQQPADPAAPGNYSAVVDAVVVKCSAADTAAWVTATVDSAGNVLSVADETPLGEEEMVALYGPDRDGVQGLMAGWLNASYVAAAENYFNLGLSWYNTHLAMLHPDVVASPAGGNLTHLPDVGGVAGALEDVVGRLYGTSLRLYAAEVFG
ncbi:hypothetical protein P167DRAFT_569178, partial [Morchella conica CCBAS932]